MNDPTAILQKKVFEHYRRKDWLRDVNAKDMKYSVAVGRHIDFHRECEKNLDNYEFQIESDLVFKVKNKNTNGMPHTVELLPEDAMICVPQDCAVNCPRNFFKNQNLLQNQ